MITPNHSRAIGQILTEDGKPLGTGSLIVVNGNISKVLTARHVLMDHQRVKVRFDKAGQEMTSSGIVRGAHDWALVTIEAPSDVEPLVLYQPPRTTETVRWWTIGFPSLAAFTRASFHGEVRIVDDDEIDLHCIELRAEAPSSASDGLSGAPCLIDGGVAGILTDVLKVRGVNPTAAIYVLPSKIISDEAKLPLMDGTELPFELFFTAAVQTWPPAGLQIAAAIAKLGRSMIPPPHIIARRMINEGIEITGSVLRGVQRPIGERDPLIELASSLWVDGRAAAHMDEAIERDQVSLLTTDSELSAEHHLWRAFAHRNSGYPSWDYVYIGAIDGDLGEVVDDVDTKLREKFGDISSSALAEIIEAEDRAGRRVTVFLHGAPRAKLTRRLKSAWAKLRIVYFIATDVSTVRPPGVEVIEPGHDRAQVERATNARKRWRHQLGLSTEGGAR